MEHKALQHQFCATTGSGSNNSSPRSGTPENTSNQDSTQNPAGTSGKMKNLHRPSISKRISVPENFTYFPTREESSKVGMQQQLMQYRIHQKRQIMPSKPSIMLSASARRNLLTRQSGMKSGKPYMPQDMFSSGIKIYSFLVVRFVNTMLILQPQCAVESTISSSNPSLKMKQTIRTFPKCITQLPAAMSAALPKPWPFAPPPVQPHSWSPSFLPACPCRAVPRHLPPYTSPRRRSAARA